MTELHPLFIERIKKQFPAESDSFLQAIDFPAKVSVHVKGNALKEFWDKPVVHYANGSFLRERPKFTVDPHFHLGHYYPQESSSMVVGCMVHQITDKINVREALDLCAAPGGKTILLSENLSSNVVIYANEVSPKRNQILQENLMKWGLTNAVVLQSEVAQIKGDEQWDLILLDAPCSGEGMFRKDPQSRKEWTPEQVVKCAGIQVQLVQEAYRLLAPGGVLIYSTCTFSQNENQDIVSYCSHTLGLKGFDGLIMPNGAKHYNIDGISAWQFLPHLVSGEGFFCCAMQKPDSTSKGRVKLANDSFWQPLHKRDWGAVSSFVVDTEIKHYWQNGKGEVFYSTINQENIMPVAKTVQIGTQIGMLNKGVFSPHQGLILSKNSNKEIPRYSLEADQALDILRGQDLRIDDTARNGWHIVQWDGWDLAWVKMVRGRVSNHYPKDWRIRFL